MFGDLESTTPVIKFFDEGGPLPTRCANDWDFLLRAFDTAMDSLCRYYLLQERVESQGNGGWTVDGEGSARLILLQEICRVLKQGICQADRVLQARS